MATTPQIRQEWISNGKKRKATHVFVICDTFSYEDYPVYVDSQREYDEVHKKYITGANMQRIMEIIKL